MQWVQKLSIFHYAYEALLVNEVTFLTLTEKKFGLSIDVPGATILSTFGFNAQALWSDVIGLAIYFCKSLSMFYDEWQLICHRRLPHPVLRRHALFAHRETMMRRLQFTASHFLFNSVTSRSSH